VLKKKRFIDSKKKYTGVIYVVADSYNFVFLPRLASPGEKSRINELKWREAKQKHANK
jgi:hypothetical protein